MRKLLKWRCFLIAGFCPGPNHAGQSLFCEPRLTGELADGNCCKAWLWKQPRRAWQATRSFGITTKLSPNRMLAPPNPDLRCDFEVAA
jgi:hypothetical protein